jgi:hypothetical protein
MKIVMLALGVLLLPVAAFAQPPRNLPPNAQAALEESVKACDKKVTFKTGFVTEKDINGDGIKDYILDYGAFLCGEDEGYFCGSAGCQTQVFASLPKGGYVKVLDENVRGLTFSRVKGRPAMVLALHGNACDKVGAAPCRMTFLWNGKTFAPAK